MLIAAILITSYLITRTCYDKCSAVDLPKKYTLVTERFPPLQTNFLGERDGAVIASVYSILHIAFTPRCSL